MSEIKIAFSAVKNEHLSFKNLCNNFGLREIKNYLEAAIDSKNLKKYHVYFRSDYPFNEDFYTLYYNKFKKAYLEKNPEVFI